MIVKGDRPANQPPNERVPLVIEPLSPRRIDVLEVRTFDQAMQFDGGARLDRVDGRKRVWRHEDLDDEAAWVPFDDSFESGGCPGNVV